jgi:hypothetical protein
MNTVSLGRYRTRDGAPRGKRPRIEDFQDLLLYRDEQRRALEAGQITFQLFRTRVRRWATRYYQMAENRSLLRDRAQANPREKTV